MSIFLAVIRVGKPIYQGLDSILRFMGKHKELTLILFLSFMIRYLLMDWNSYWLDELYSVYDRGIKLDSALEVLKFHQAQKSAMPLYEFILYNWMKIFGHTEIATRSLSALYVTFATLFFYCFTIRVFGRRIAIASTLLFTFSYMAVYYSLESRYYGQILFLSTLSSFLLLVYLESLKDCFFWRSLLRNKYLFLLTLTNVALMLTHPFNYLFISAQGFFVLFHFLYLNRSSLLLNFVKVCAIYLIQLAVMISLWGFAIFRQFAGQVGGDGAADSAFVSFKNPFSIFMDFVLAPNLQLSTLAYTAILALFIVFVIKYAIRFYRLSLNRTVLTRKLFIIYVVLLAILPSFFVFLIFSMGQLDKLTPRYLIFCTPAVILILVLALEQGVSLLDGMVRRLMRISLIRNYLRYATIYAIIATMLFTAPGGYRAATKRKADWRGIANQIVQQIHVDSGHKYIIYEMSFRDYPLLDYYFEQYSDQVRVYDTIQRVEEANLQGGSEFVPRFMTAESISEIGKHDFLVLAFTHHLPSQFPQTLAVLTEEYKLVNSYLDGQGRGYMVFMVKPDTE